MSLRKRLHLPPLRGMALVTCPKCGAHTFGAVDQAGAVACWVCKLPVAALDDGSCLKCGGTAHNGHCDGSPE